MTDDLVALLLAWEQYGRQVPTWSRTSQEVLLATMAARLRYDAPGLAKIAQLADMPLGTLKAARSRGRRLREAMDAVGGGPRGDFYDELTLPAGWPQRLTPGLVVTAGLVLIIDGVGQSGSSGPHFYARWLELTGLRT